MIDFIEKSRTSAEITCAYEAAPLLLPQKK